MKRGATDNLDDNKPTKLPRKDMTKQVLQAVDLLNDHDFFLYWDEELKNNITFEALIATTVDGKSALTRLCKSRDSARFSEVWERDKKHFKMEHFLGPLQSFAYANDPNIFFTIWEQFKASIEVEHLLGHADDSGIFTSLIYLAEKDKPELFLEVWEQFKDQLKAENCLFFLNRLASLAVKGKPALFLKVFERFKRDFKAENFLAKTSGKPSILCLLACEGWCSNPPENSGEAFLAVLDHFKEIFKLEDLLESYYVSVLTVMYWKPKTKIVLYHYLTQLPGVIPESNNVFSYLAYEDRNLILQRNSFFNKLAILKTSSPGGRLEGILIFIRYKKSFDDELKELSELADKALEAGYRNAYYDLGKYLDEMGYDWAEAFEKVPAGSIYYQEVCLKLSEYYFGKAIDTDVKDLKKQFLKKALEYSRNIPDESTRRENIQRIASVYEFNDSYHLLPQSSFEAVNKNTSTEEYFLMFDRKKDEMTVKACASKEVKEKEKPSP